ncbi:hypothetical protein MUP01_08905 [Candidatus Bathyarchaeota archaeon]|nr:hypothetical protein [Candidatus Bathyarchaeota archaeon]
MRKQKSKGVKDDFAASLLMPQSRCKCHMLRCRKCQRKILVEVGLLGVDHTSVISVICGECLKQDGLSKSFRRKHPEESREMEDWIKS